MRKYYIQLMEMANDGTQSVGMGGAEITTAPATVSSEQIPTTSNPISNEADALSFLGGLGTQETSNQNTTLVQEQNQSTQTTEPFDIGTIDMSMFGLPNEPQVTQQIVQPTQEPQVVNQEVQQANLLQQIYNKLNTPVQNEPQVDQEELAALSVLAEKFQKAGLLPKGLSDEDKQLLEEAKAMRDEIKQQKEMQAQQVEFNNKISAIDSYSKQLESLIPGYSTPFMQKLVAQITQQNPQAGQQILNNPLMLTQLWATYGHKSQPKQQSTNIISNGSSQVGNTDLFEKVKSGQGSIDDEARLLASL